MQLDECVALPAPEKEIERAMQLSLRWAERSKAAFFGKKGHGIFGIVQGGDVERLRVESAEALKAMNFHGYAVGGLAVGEPQDVMLRMLEAVCPVLPTDKPRYLMGVGTPDDILKSVARGIDMFDCVMPTRAGRHGLAYTGVARSTCAMRAMRMIRARSMRREQLPGRSRLFARLSASPRAHEEALGAMLLTWVNLWYYQDLMAGMRAAIADGRFADHYEEVQAGWAAGDIAVVG